jgi:capsule polysaccharide export protein KpsE/RkpR
MKGRFDDMSENLLRTLQQLIQDVIAPDVRELKVRMTSLEKQNEVQFQAISQRFDSSDEKHDAQFQALLSAIAESKAQAELSFLRVLSALSERVAVLESQRQ